MDFPHMKSKPVIHEDVFVASDAKVLYDVILNKDVSIWFSCVLRGDINSIIVGEGSNIQDGSVVHVSDDHSAVIGEYVVVGHQATVHACTIEDNCLIGMKSTVLDGAVIGEGSIIGAGAVVGMGKVIPPRSLVLGIPGKVVRSVTEEEYKYTRHLADKYIHLKNEYLA